MDRRRFAGVLAAASASLVSCGETVASPYPSRDIKMVVQAAPGGLSDTVSRVIASQMEASLGVPVVTENKPGAAGALAFSFVSRRPADGYTLGHAPVELAILRTLGFTQVSPETVDPLCLVSQARPLLVTSPSSGFRSFPEFLQKVKARPGHFIAGNSGTGSIWHLNTLLMEQDLGLQLIHVPFPGSSASVTNLLGGHIDLAVMGVGEAASQVSAGALLPLAVFDRERSPLLPDVPCVGEMGHQFGANAWSGFFGPKGLPGAVKQTLLPAFRRAFQSEMFQQVCAERGMEPTFLDEVAFRTFAITQAKFFAERVPQLLGVN